MTLSTDQGFVLYLMGGMILRGWALAAQGQGAEESAQMRQGLAGWHATGAELWRPYWLALLADASGKGGRVEEGLAVLDEALAVVDNTGEHFWEAELFRLKGALLLLRSAEHHAEAETYFHQALDVARRQITILPAMTLAEALETTRIPRVAGLTGGRTALMTCPCAILLTIPQP
jgi:predicted ATPase